MNILLLLVGLRPWSAPSSRALLTRVFVAISVLSVEMQIVTWVEIGSLRGLLLLNAVVAALALAFWRPPAHSDDLPSVRVTNAVPPVATLLLAAVVTALNLGKPLEAADPYHLDKIDRIERVGTLAYDPAVEKKVNILNSMYELVLADLRHVPLVGPWIVRLHGLVGLLLYLLAVAAARELLRAGPGWEWAVVLTVPVVFHQLVLVKNDLFVAVPGLVALTWVVARVKEASWTEVLWAAWLAGLAVAVKLTTLALLVVLVGMVILKRRTWQPVAAAAAGTLLGFSTGGLFFTLVQNVRFYGELMPAEDISSRYAGTADHFVGIGRFVISLFDLGVFTRVWWPGRGGWGGTFGLPLVWSLVVLIARSRRSPEARAALLYAGTCFLAFAIVFPDADVGHRLALAPGLLLIVVATALAKGVETRWDEWMRLALTAVVLLSGAQLLRSAFLYFVRP